MKFFSQMFNTASYSTASLLLTFAAVVSYLGAEKSDLIYSMSANQPLGMAFKGECLVRFWLACWVGLIVSALVALDLSVDAILRWQPVVDDRFERIFMMSLQFMRAVSLLWYLDTQMITVTYLVAFSLHGIGLFCMVLLLFHRLFPLDFPLRWISFSQASVILGSIFLFIGYGLPSNNVLIGLFAALSIVGWGVAIYMFVAWALACKLFKKPLVELTIEQLYVLVYVVQIIFQLITPLVTLRKESECSYCMNSLTVLVQSYTSSIVVFIIGILPGLVSKCMAIYAMKNAMEVKRILTQYVNQEIRSPLSVLLSGIELLPDELQAGKPLEELLDSISDLHHSCNSAISICTDITDIGEVDNGGFAMDLRVSLAGEIFPAICHHCQRIVNQKGLSFDFDDQIGHSEMYIFVDTERVEHIVRNLVIHACGSTAFGGFISVTIRRKQASHGRDRSLPGHGDEESENDNEWGLAEGQSPHRKESVLLRRLRGCLDLIKGEQDSAYARPESSTALSVASSSSSSSQVGLAVYPDDPSLQRSGQLVIEVADSGAGLSPTALARMKAYLRGKDARGTGSGSGTGTGASGLQMIRSGLESGMGAVLAAGSGSGSESASRGLSLGLWIARTIVHAHGGSISVSSQGQNLGSTFTVRLPAYRESSTYTPGDDLEMGLEGYRDGNGSFGDRQKEDFVSAATGVNTHRSQLLRRGAQGQFRSPRNSGSSSGSSSTQQQQQQQQHRGSDYDDGAGDDLATALERQRETKAARRGQFRRNRTRPPKAVPSMSTVEEEDEDDEKSSDSSGRISHSLRGRRIGAATIVSGTIGLDDDSDEEKSDEEANEAEMRVLIVDDSSDHSCRKSLGKVLTNVYGKAGVALVVDHAEDGADATEQVAVALTAWRRHKDAIAREQEISCHIIEPKGASSDKENKDSGASTSLHAQADREGNELAGGITETLSPGSATVAKETQAPPRRCEVMQFRCVFINDNMRQGDGPKVAETLRGLGYMGPIIGLTGSSTRGDFARLKRSGIDAVVGKPFKMTELERVLRSQRLLD